MKVPNVSKKELNKILNELVNKGYSSIVVEGIDLAVVTLKQLKEWGVKVYDKETISS